MVEVNEVLYPEQFDTEQNFPSVTEVTEATGESINRNRDAIVVIERTLGVKPHIGLFTEDELTATVDQRLDIIENGIAEGRFAFRNLNVNNVLVATTDQAGFSSVDLGSTPEATRIAPVNIRGPLRIFDSELSNNQAEIYVPFVSSARANVIEASSIEGQPLLRITDVNINPALTNRPALKIEGNVEITNGRLFADFAVNHNQLLGIDTISRPGINALHVTRGDYHSHVRKRDPATGALLNEVDPNPSEETFGLISHTDLLNIFTKNGQTDFIPIEGIAYHVTGGDEHDHKDGRGAPIDHNSLLNIDPAISNHVTGGDSHAHSPDGDGAPINHDFLTNIGFLSHTDIDRILNIEFRDHIELIDPADPSQIDETQAALGHHVPQGHVSDPNAHHTRYTDQEALAAVVLVSAATGTYLEGNNTTTLNHIQAIGNGTVSADNPHGLAAADVGALEGFDTQGNLPDFTRQFLEQAVADIIDDPEFSVLRSTVNEEITALWTFNVVGDGGIIIGDGASSTTTFNYARAVRLDDLIAHVDNTGGTSPILAASQPPFHDARDIRYDSADATTIPLSATDVDGALDELDAAFATKADNPVPTAQIDNLAVTNGKLATNSVSTSKIVDGDVTLAKLANPQSFVVYTFNGQVGTEPADAYGNVDVRSFGCVLPAECSGTIEEVSVMRDEIVGGSTSNTVEVEADISGGGFSSILTTSPEEVVSFTDVAPALLPAFTQQPITGGDRLRVTIGEVGGGLVEISVAIVVKLDHTTT